MTEVELRKALEAVLFVSAEPLGLKRLSEIVEEANTDRIVTLLAELKDAYGQANHGIDVVEVAGGYQLTTVTEAGAWVRRMYTAKAAPRLSKPALETLAIIAYKQPLTRPEIEAIRGVDVAGVVKTLIDRRLIKIVGRKDVLGRPMTFGTTLEFLQIFGLKDLSDLPTLRDFADIASAPEFAGDAADDSEATQDIDVELGEGNTTSVDVEQTSPLT